MYEEKTLEKAISLALRYLYDRPRSEFEVRSRLRRRYDEQIAETVIERLTEQGLLDDIAFAHAWSQGRTSSRPRSAALIRRELLVKGLDRETAQTAVENLDDEENAYNAGLQAGTSLAKAEMGRARSGVWGPVIWGSS